MKMPKKLITQGAEAKLYLDEGKVIKERFKKSYRIKEIDEKLRSFRTRREAKILQRLSAINFPSPKLIRSDDKENITMEKVRGNLLKDMLEESHYKNLCSEIGRKIALLHNNSIIHGDLTTSNMIFNNEIYFIDFSLGGFSSRIEDKGVDLKLFLEALNSTHFKISDICWSSFIEGYKKE